MGKSPGKWIKTLLFGKKSSKSNLSKGRDSFKSVDEKGALFSAKTPPADPVVSAPLFSQPVSVTANRNERNSELERVHDGVVLRLGSQDTDVNGTGQSVASHDPERIREEKAAIKAQAAFRGYLARRAFRALRGIIRLQALVRGHLVRRQAVATLRCMQGIVKLQALVRGRRVRLSVVGIEVHEKCKTRNALEDAKHFGSVGVKTSSKQKEKLWKNAFICKHVASSTSVMPLRFQYDLGEPNSAWSWLALWTISRIWEPLPQVKKVTDSKSQTRSKRSVRRVPAANLENGSMRSSSELDKPKRNFRKVLSQPVDPVHGSPQNELEKVKRNLKKISSSTNGTAERVETEVGKPKHISKKAIESSAPDVPNRGMVEFLEKPKIETSVSVSKHRDIEDPVQSLVADEAVDVLPDDHTAVDTSPLENSAKDENIQVTNGELTPKHDKSSNENQKGSRRRASLPAKQEYPENGVQNSPKLPSYMAATESAKAKLRGLGSPKPGLDGVEQNGLMRRHSLPSAPNGMLSSLSPRTQKLVQASGKGGVKSDRSLLASRDRDGNEKVVHAEWKR